MRRRAVAFTATTVIATLCGWVTWDSTREPQEPIAARPSASRPMSAAVPSAAASVAGPQLTVDQTTTTSTVVVVVPAETPPPSVEAAPVLPPSPGVPPMLAVPVPPAEVSPPPAAVLPTTPPAVAVVPFYGSCADARAAGAAPIAVGQPGYRPALDRDGDGTACDTDTQAASATTTTTGPPEAGPPATSPPPTTTTTAAVEAFHGAVCAEPGGHTVGRSIGVPAGQNPLDLWCYADSWRTIQTVAAGCPGPSVWAGDVYCAPRPDLSNSYLMDVTATVDAEAAVAAAADRAAGIT